METQSPKHEITEEEIAQIREYLRSRDILSIYRLLEKLPLCSFNEIEQNKSTEVINGKQ